MDEVFISYKAEKYEEANNVRIILEKTEFLVGWLRKV